MKPIFHTKTITWKEVFFQTTLHILVFFSFAFDKHHPAITILDFVFFANYAVAVFLINYYFLPNYFYHKKYISFTVAVFLSLFVTAIIEEGILETIFFPNTRGGHLNAKGVILSFFDLLPLAATLSGFKFAWDLFGKQKEVEELKSLVKESELQFLKSQINPHFLFNNLNNLYAYAIEKSPKTPEIILQLSSVLRYMLYECKDERVALSKEIEQIKNYMQISEMQIEDRGTVMFECDSFTGEYNVAPLILIVFIENAYKHSTASQTDGIEISVRLELSDSGTLDFYCKNSYLEQSNTDSLTQGIGLENVKKRLQLLYPDLYTLRLNSANDLYEVHLTIELEKH